MSDPCERRKSYQSESDNRLESTGSDVTIQVSNQSQADPSVAGVDMLARPVADAASSPTENNLSSFTESKEDSYSSGIFSPDIFNENDDDKFFMYNEDFNIYNQKIITKIEKSLQGVPPHPSITISQLTVEEMLNLYNTNLSKFNGSESADDRPTSSKDCDKSYDSNSGNSSYSNLVQGPSKRTDYFFEEDQKRTSSCWIGSDELQDLAMTGKWPDITSCRYYGLHYNTSSYTEEVDRLLSRYLSRYVGCETASSCVLTCCKSPLKKGLRSNIGRSPGKRLSYMTRRRIEMCTAKNFKGAIALNRQVYIDRKKLGNIKIDRLQNVRRSPRLKKTPKKGSLRKKTPKSRTPGSKKKSATKRVETPNKSLSAKKGPKRALFLSPDSELNPDASQGPSSSMLNRSKRILFESPTKESPTKTPSSSKNEQLCKKRKLDDSFSNPDNSHRAKLRKSLTFGGDTIEDLNTSQSGVRPLTRHASEQIPNKLQQMSSLHNKKLLWAVAEALRAHNIGLKHDQFKLYMASLAKLTRKLVTLPFHARMLTIPGTSTSDTLLKIARQHSFSVIRGKSVDDIFKEEQQKQTVAHMSKNLGRTPMKIFEGIGVSQVGSVNIRNCENAFGNLGKNGKSSCASNVKTVLQDKTINIETKVPYVGDLIFESSLKKNMNNRTTMLLHKASRQIHFDDVDDNFSR